MMMANDTVGSSAYQQAQTQATTNKKEMRKDRGRSSFKWKKRYVDIRDSLRSRTCESRSRLKSSILDFLPYPKGITYSISMDGTCSFLD